MSPTSASQSRRQPRPPPTSHMTPRLLSSYPDFQISVHDLPRTLKHEISAIFPALRELPPSPILLIPTIQRSALDLLEFGKAEEVEKDRLLAQFVVFAKRLRTELQRRGYWCDATDPVTGCAYFGVNAGGYSDVNGIQRVLQYSTRDVGGCRVLEHPDWGFAIYPGKFIFRIQHIFIILNEKR